MPLVRGRVLRGHRGWVAALLLVALAFVGGPDVIDTQPPVTQASVSALQKQADVPGGVADQAAPAHRLLAALPPSPQTHAPGPEKGILARVLPPARAAVLDPGSTRRLDASSPEALQIFLC
jgi:hypothetical protein